MQEQENQEGIPEINISENKEIILSEIGVPLRINGELINIRMRKLSSGERNAIRKKYTKTSYKNREPIIEVDEVGYMEETLSLAIIEAPFDKSKEGIRKLSGEVADYLFDKYVNESEITEKKN
jgi:hypothetical protein